MSPTAWWTDQDPPWFSHTAHTPHLSDPPPFIYGHVPLQCVGTAGQFLARSGIKLSLATRGRARAKASASWKWPTQQSSMCLLCWFLLSLIMKVGQTLMLSSLGRQLNLKFVLLTFHFILEMLIQPEDHFWGHSVDLKGALCSSGEYIQS